MAVRDRHNPISSRQVPSSGADLGSGQEAGQQVWAKGIHRAATHLQLQLKQSQGPEPHLQCSCLVRGKRALAEASPDTALMPKSLEGRGSALSCAVSRLPMSPGCQTSRNGDDALGALLSGCMEGTCFVKGPIFPV